MKRRPPDLVDEDSIPAGVTIPPRLFAAITAPPCDRGPRPFGLSDIALWRGHGRQRRMTFAGKPLTGRAGK